MLYSYKIRNPLEEAVEIRLVTNPNFVKLPRKRDPARPLITPPPNWTPLQPLLAQVWVWYQSYNRWSSSSLSALVIGSNTKLKLEFFVSILKKWFWSSRFLTGAHHTPTSFPGSLLLTSHCNVRCTDRCVVNITWNEHVSQRFGCSHHCTKPNRLLHLAIA